MFKIGDKVILTKKSQKLLLNNPYVNLEFLNKSWTILDIQDSPNGRLLKLKENEVMIGERHFEKYSSWTVVNKRSS